MYKYTSINLRNEAKPREEVFGFWGKEKEHTLDWKRAGL